MDARKKVTFPDLILNATYTATFYHVSKREHGVRG